MHVVLIFTGVLATVAGFAMIAFGIPISAFGLGNLLITCGTIATVGGVILVGLAFILRQLHRLVDVLEAKPVPVTAAVNENIEELREPQLTPVSASLSTPAPSSLAPQRSELSLSPRQLDPRPLRPEPDIGGRNAAPEIRSPALDAGDAALAPEIVANRNTALVSDAISPGNVRLAEPAPARQSADETPRPAAEAAGGRPAKKREPMFRAGARARAELGLPEPSTGNGPDATEADARPVVLKSGVIEGMAYTLYADGSIDAELAEGTVKFNSIPELRSHLGHHPR